MWLMLVEFWSWWFIAGWATITKRVAAWVVSVWQLFSVAILLRTLMYPWKRIITPPAKSIDGIVKAMIDNTVSRVVGFFVRSIVIFVALFMTSFAAIFGMAFILVWPLLPAIALYLVIRGITG